MNFLWPAIDGLEDAKKACRTAASSAFVVTIITGVATVLSMQGMLKDILPPLDASAFIDAGIFLLLGIFLARFSRIAAVIALVLYVFEQGMMMSQGGHFNFMAIYFAITFISGVRGSFAYQELKGTEEETPIPAEPTPEEIAQKKRQKIVRLIFILILLVGGGMFFLRSYTSGKTKFEKTSFKNSIALSEKPPSAMKSSPHVSESTQETAAPAEAGSKTFKLKNGKTVRGQILLEDPIYYTVETFGGKQEIVIKEDLAEPPQ